MILPSTRSIVPLTRCVPGGCCCWARAAETVSAVARTATFKIRVLIMLLPPRVDHASLRVSLSVAVNATLHGQAWLGDLCGYCRRPGADAVKASLRPGDLLIHGALKRFIRLGGVGSKHGPGDRFEAFTIGTHHKLDDHDASPGGVEAEGIAKRRIEHHRGRAGRGR